MSAEHGRFEKTFSLAVPVGTAWEAFTDPKLLEVWLTGTVVEADLSPGGRIAWEPDEYGQLVWEVKEVEPERRLVYTEGPGILPVPTEVTVTFAESSSGTEVTITQAGFGEGSDWQARLDSVGLGWVQSLAGLDLYLRTGVRYDRFFTFRSDLGMEVSELFAGPLVRSVTSGSFADAAGLRAGDIVLRLGEAPVFSRADLWLFTREHATGEEVEVTYVRGGTLSTGRAALT